MIKALNIVRNITKIPIQGIIRPKFKVTSINRLSLGRVAYNFSSEGSKLPRNKEEAWMMQEQQRIKENPLDENDENTYSTFNKWGVVGFVILAGGLISLVLWADKKSQDNLRLYEDEKISGYIQEKEQQSLVGGDWTLVDTEGQPFSSRMLGGYYYLVYFGYTNSPDATPSALYYLSTVYRVIRNIPEGAYLKLKVVFISIDPERDTPSKVKSFLSHFHKSIIGVTASDPNDPDLKECLKKFKIHGKKVYNEKSQKKDSYEMDYNTRVFLMDSTNKYMWHVDPQLTEQQVAKVIVSKIVSKEHMKEKQLQQAGI